MAEARLRRVRELFDQALEQPPESRPAFLDEACAGDPELREEVASLLAADEAGDSASVATGSSGSSGAAGSGSSTSPNGLSSHKASRSR